MTRHENDRELNIGFGQFGLESSRSARAIDVKHHTAWAVRHGSAFQELRAEVNDLTSRPTDLNRADSPSRTDVSSSTTNTVGMGTTRVLMNAAVGRTSILRTREASCRALAICASRLRRCSRHEGIVARREINGHRRHCGLRDADQQKNPKRERPGVLIVVAS